MDSANSGSLQSSSGGDEEYDSRAADSVSAYMSTGGGVPIPNPPPQFFDPLSGYLQLHQNPNSLLLNSNLSWPRISTPPLRSDPNPIVFPTSSPFMPSFQGAGIGLDSSSAAAGGGPAAPAAASPAARNPKKRSRASRRAPTTVLTTDTTNFRAMVQEFTGIPAPPFNSSSFPRSRLDFFGSRSSALDAAQPPPYLRRPFAQKVSTTNSASSSMNYQLPMPQSFNIPNQNILTSLLQSNPKFPFSTTSSSKPQNAFPSNDDHFSLGHHSQVSETLAGLPNLIPSDPHNDTTNAARWSSPKDDRVDLRPLYDFQRNAKITNFSPSSTSENVAAPAAAVRGEGMVESWICSSE